MLKGYHVAKTYNCAAAAFHHIKFVIRFLLYIFLTALFSAERPDVDCPRGHVLFRRDGSAGGGGLHQSGQDLRGHRHLRRPKPVAPSCRFGHQVQPAQPGK